MTVTLEQICEGIEARLATIGGLSAYDNSAGAPVLPAALVIPPPINYRETFAVGVVSLPFEVVVLVGASWHENQNLLRQYLDWSGSSSILVTIDAAPTLGLAGVDAKVLSSRPLGLEEVAGYEAFGAAVQLLVAVTNTP